MISAPEALQRLREGNRRFANNQLQRGGIADPGRRRELAAGQQPFAVILGCSDSRVPVELVFDQGLGDLFVIRVAGNIATPEVIGSVEFAADNLGTRLVVVLGHSGCGAVQATLGEIEEPSENPSPNLDAIVEAIRPALEPLQKANNSPDRGSLMKESVRANVQATVQIIARQSPLLAELAQEDGLKIAGAEYSLETGVVEFF